MKVNIATLFILSLLLFACGQQPKQNQSTENETTNQEAIPEAETVDEPEPQHFEETLTYGNFSYILNVKGDSVTIQPKGFKGTEAIFFTLKGQLVQNAATGDLNGDGYPEVVIFSNEPGNSELYINGYSPNNGLSFSMFAWVPVDQHPDLKEGYRGEDEMEIIENTLVQRFPLFDPDGKKTGKMRQIQYKLVEGEALRQLKIDRVTEF